MQKSKEEIQDLRSKYPSVPEYALPKTKKKKSPANQLTSDIILHLNKIGGYGFRINSSGTYSEALGKYIYSGSEKGVSDVIACYQGQLIGIEVKVGRDKQSEIQKNFQDRIESAGGKYMIARNFERWKREFEELMVDC